MESVKLTSLKFQVETATSIRVIDEEMLPPLVGRIQYNRMMGQLEFDSTSGYTFSADDLLGIAAYMLKFNINNPSLI